MSFFKNIFCQTCEVCRKFKTSCEVSKIKRVLRMLVTGISKDILGLGIYVIQKDTVHTTNFYIAIC